LASLSTDADIQFQAFQQDYSIQYQHFPFLRIPHSTLFLTLADIFVAAKSANA
jgi:hypothetical protein